MKIFIIAVALLSLASSGCKKVEKISYAGVFILNKQTLSASGWDTSWMKDQAKIYTDHYYIYAGTTSDQDVRFGLGTYELDTAHTVVEHNIFNSKALDSTQIFVVKINKTSKGFIGIVPGWTRSNGTIYKLTEVYSEIASPAASALDGVWELDKIYWVKGKDTIRQHRNQFKVFWQGHFIVIQRYPTDPVGTKLKNGFEYGKFYLAGNNLYEREEMSDRSALTGNNVALRISFNSQDEYIQTGNDLLTHSPVTEIYKRVKTY